MSTQSDIGWLTLSQMVEFSDSKQGYYVRNNTLMSNEELCEKVREYVWAAPRGDPTSHHGLSALG